jgi:ADP-ribose pyrophosphatase
LLSISSDEIVSTTFDEFIMNKRILILFLAHASCLFGESDLDTPDRVKQYLQFAKEHPHLFGELGAWKNHEIEIILTPDRIQKIEKQTSSRLLARGCSEKEAKSWSSVGIVAEDYYWIWIRDPVIFPSGVYGTYDRLVWKSGSEGPPSVGILPILSNKKVIVNVVYRHATRSWEMELPRGRKKMGETEEIAAQRELNEETGYHTTRCRLLGTMAPDSGVLVSVIPIFYAEVKHSGQSSIKNFSKAIVQNPAFSKDEIKAGFSKGYIEMPIQGEQRKVHCRDPYLAFAFLQAEIKGLL